MFTEITSKDNQNIKKAVKLKKSAKYRRETNMFIAEGLRICTDAMFSSARIESLFVTDKAKEKHPCEFQQLADYALNTYIVSPELFSFISDTENPQGFLCIIKSLDKTYQFDTIKNSDKFLALDNVQDPNNLGTILRTAEALGLDGVVMSKDCCDIYNPKVVRGSMGAVFRLPFVICNSIKEFLSNNQMLNSYAAVVSSDPHKITETSFIPPCVAVIGNEGNGLKRETIDSCTFEITIPMKGRAESLNASTAAAIIMWEMIK
ncbi:MAG: RNA methyltransferase [Clostridiales bacterium]|nr:RNA methyltransferase [Clostridiales bacterium]